ncbi:hypothetical protein [Fulvivirga sp.]|uniref:hypothetical protein n=1 Tax=Fulvivirga sp. TaxID=1931237 RepID=UPI0032EE81ED
MRFNNPSNEFSEALKTFFLSLDKTKLNIEPTLRLDNPNIMMNKYVWDMFLDMLRDFMICHSINPEDEVKYHKLFIEDYDRWRVKE